MLHENEINDKSFIFSYLRIYVTQGLTILNNHKVKYY